MEEIYRDLDISLTNTKQMLQEYDPSYGIERYEMERLNGCLENAVEVYQEILKKYKKKRVKSK